MSEAKKGKTPHPNSLKNLTAEAQRKRSEASKGERNHRSPVHNPTKVRVESNRETQTVLIIETQKQYGDGLTSGNQKNYRIPNSTGSTEADSTGQYADLQ